MTFLAFIAANGIHRYSVDLPTLKFIMDLLVMHIKLVVEELHFCFSVAVDAPSHAQVLNLYYTVHVLHLTMTFSAVKLANVHMLGMVEIGMIRKVVNPDPFYGLAAFDRLIDLGDLFCSCMGTLFYYVVAIHAQLGWRDAGMLTFIHREVAVTAVDLIIFSMYLMRESDRLIG
jgi:hypothetical protein